MIKFKNEKDLMETITARAFVVGHLRDAMLNLSDCPEEARGHFTKILDRTIHEIGSEELVVEGLVDPNECDGNCAECLDNPFSDHEDSEPLGVNVFILKRK